MGRAKPLQIGRIAFVKQQDAQAYIRDILDSSPWGMPLTGEIHEFLLSLLHRHPNATQKIGQGVEYFTVNNDGNGDRCFYIHHLGGGTPQHFSYLKSLRGEDDVRSLVLGALNRAVEDQIWTFRDAKLAEGPQQCPYTGKTITKDHCHVDHPNPTFLELHTMWFKWIGLQHTDIRLSDGNGNQIGRTMTDPNQKKAWQDFHLQNAKLRLLSPRGNMSAAKIEANQRIRAGDLLKH